MTGHRKEKKIKIKKRSNANMKLDGKKYLVPCAKRYFLTKINFRKNYISS